MALSQSSPSSFASLDVISDLRHWSYRIPGFFTWGLFLLMLAGAVIFPYETLTVARVITIIMFARVQWMILCYLYGVIQLRKTAQRVEAPGFDYAPGSTTHHLVIIPNFKEPTEILERTLHALAVQHQAAARVSIVLAMEESDPHARQQAAYLIERFSASFARIFATFHPAGIENEIPGKAANQTWAARKARSILVDQAGIPLDTILVTSCDADSTLHPSYLAEVARRFEQDPRRHDRIWQVAVLFDANIWEVVTSIRMMTFYTNAIILSELINPFAFPMPHSTYTLSFKLIHEIGYWDVAVISEDWHLLLRAFFATRGKANVSPILLPVHGEAIVGRGTWDAWKNYYNQALRHAWGSEEVAYIFQQDGRRRGIPWGVRFLRYQKIINDQLIFSLSTIAMLIGTVLSIILFREPILTLPSQTAFPILTAGFNLLGGVLSWMVWYVERRRCNGRKSVWQFITVLSEIATWAMVPFIAIGLMGVPVIHAQTKMAFASPLTYSRTPKTVN